MLEAGQEFLPGSIWKKAAVLVYKAAQMNILLELDPSWITEKYSRLLFPWQGGACCRGRGAEQWRRRKVPNSCAGFRQPGSPSGCWDCSSASALHLTKEVTPLFFLPFPFFSPEQEQSSETRCVSCFPLPRQRLRLLQLHNHPFRREESVSALEF